MAHPDLQELLDSLLPFAQSMLSQHGSFNPYGAFVSSDGEIQWISADTGEEFPAAQTLIDTMNGVFQEDAAAGKIRAATICYDARTIPPGQTVKTDAIAFSLEQRSGDSITVFLPYQKAGDGAIQYGELFATEKTAQFFQNPAATNG
jgi:hypothetical protein